MCSKRSTALEESALETAASRGHRMTAFQPIHEQEYIAESVCEQCEAYAQVNAKAKGKEVSAGGTALIFNCNESAVSASAVK